MGKNPNQKAAPVKQRAGVGQFGPPLCGVDGSKTRPMKRPKWRVCEAHGHRLYKLKGK